MRSVIVTERDYRQQDQVSQVRSDELLQMFGRAGRRGLDDRGYVLVLPGKPRLEGASPIHLKRTPTLDWPTILRLMHQATQHGASPINTAHKFAESLFTSETVNLGFGNFRPPMGNSNLKTAEGLSFKSTSDSYSNRPKTTVLEIQNREGKWERRKGLHNVPLGEALALHRKKWKPAAEVAQSLSPFKFGTTCKLLMDDKRIYGKEWTIAQFPRQEDLHLVALNKQFRKQLRKTATAEKSNLPTLPKQLSLEQLESRIRPWIPKITKGGVLVDLIERNNVILARIDMRPVIVSARRDSGGFFLINPPEREIDNNYRNFDLNESYAVKKHSQHSIASIWKSLKLIDDAGNPTRRGVIFSFFNHGEGLAVAAALENSDYPVEALIWDLANLRTGHRFDHLIDIGNQLSYVCRETYGGVTYSGYLKRGLPEEYGEGGSELVQQISADSKRKHQIVGGEINTGDVERVLLEWKSVLRQVLNAPAYPWDRWLALQNHIRESHHLTERNISNLDLPPLTSAQTSRKPIPFRMKR